MPYLSIILHFEFMHHGGDEEVTICAYHFSMEKRVKFSGLINIFIIVYNIPHKYIYN